MAKEQVISAFRELCNQCETAKTGKEFQQGMFYAKRFNTIQTRALRQGMLQLSQTIGDGMFTVVDGVIDGAKITFSDFFGGKVRSRGTGGLDKFSCGRDVQKLKRKLREKTQSTERMYIHRDYCMLNYIGAEGVQGFYFQDGARISTIKQSMGLATTLLMYDFSSHASNLDGTNLYGNFELNGRGEAPAGATAEYKHYDGVFKQMLQQAAAVYYPAVSVELPTIAAPAKYVVRHGGLPVGFYDTVAEVEAAINSLCLDVRDVRPYSAVLDGNTITIASCDPTCMFYNDDDLNITISEDGTFDGCADFLQATVIQNAMPTAHVEQPCIFDESEKINKTNFYQYFVDKLQTIRSKMVGLSETGRINDGMFGADQYIAIDPQLYYLMDFARLEAMCGCSDNANQRQSVWDSLLPRFIPVKAMEGTGHWLWSSRQNLIFMTNENANIPDVEMWYDPNCGMVKSNTEMVGNVLVIDYNLTACNLGGSKFEEKLFAPYAPQNLPHLCPEVRTNCCVNGGSSMMQTTITGEKEYVEASDDYNLNLESSIVVPDGDSVTTVEWVVNFSTGGATAPVTGENVQITGLTEAQVTNISIIQATVTFASGEVSMFYLPGSKVTDC